MNSFHARQIGDKETLLGAEARKNEIDARITEKKFFWQKSAIKWIELGEFGKAGRAYENAGPNLKHQSFTTKVEKVWTVLENLQ